MFLFISPKKDLSSFGGEAMPEQQNQASWFDRITGEEKPRSMVVLFLILAILLHGWLGLWLFKPAQPDIVTRPLKVMAVALVAAPAQPPDTQQPPSLPKPVPPIKTQVKKAVPKKTPVIKKPAELPKPQLVIEEKLPTLPAIAPVQPAIVETKPVSKPLENVSHEKTNTQNIVSGVVLLVRVQPKYPSRALSRHIEGWVKIEFTISTSGEVTNETVVASEPAEIFDSEALKAIKKWKFQEKTVNGVAVEQRAIQKIDFNLAE
jgi:protein TonB